MFLAFARGAFLSGSLIIAIGAQNAFVLRQGMQRRFVLPVVLTCALCDALLICAGIAGAGALIGGRATTIITWLGAIYLVWFGGTALLRAYRGQSGLEAGGAATGSVGRVIAMTAAFTLLNPHVYLDTLVVLGSIGARDPYRVAFAVGAIAASFTWFMTLGFGARMLAPLFAKPRAWRILDLAIGVMVIAIAISLVASVPSAS